MDSFKHDQIFKSVSNAFKSNYCQKLQKSLQKRAWYSLLSTIHSFCPFIFLILLSRCIIKILQYGSLCNNNTSSFARIIKIIGKEIANVVTDSLPVSARATADGHKNHSSAKNRKEYPVCYGATIRVLQIAVAAISLRCTC